MTDGIFIAGIQGYGSDVSVGFEKLGDKMAARIPVVDTKESISFCMRKSETDNEWAEKEMAETIPLRFL